MSFISSISLILSAFKSFSLFNSCISFSSIIRSFIGSLKFLLFQLNSSLHTFISCHFTSFHVRFFHSVIQSFMDSFMLLVSFAFMPFSWHLKNHVNLSLLCISHTCCSEERCQLSFCAADHAHSPSEAFKGWFGCLRSFLYHICIDSPFFRRYSILAYLTGFLNRFGTVAWCSHKGA